MEVHHPGVHVPPADEAGGIVTRIATRMRSPSANTGAATCSIKQQPSSAPPIRLQLLLKSGMAHPIDARSSGGAAGLIAPHFLRLSKTVVGQLDELSFCKRIMRCSGPRVEITRRFPKFVKRSHASFPTLGVHPCTLGRCPLLGCVGGHRLRDNRR